MQADHKLITQVFVSCKEVSRIRLIDYKLIVIYYTIIFEAMIDSFRSLYYYQLRGDMIDYFSFKSVSEVIKNTLIDYIKNLIDFIVLDSFAVFGKNTLFNWNDNIIDHIVYLID